MATDIGKLAMVMSVNPGTFHQDMDKAAGHVKSFGNIVATIGTGNFSLSAMFSALPGPIGAASASLGGLGAAFTKAAEKGAAFIADVTGLARRFAVDLAGANQLAAASSRLGIDTDTLGTSLNHMNMVLGHAAAGGTEAQRAFTSLGLNFRDLVNQPVNKTLGQIGDALGHMNSQAERTAAAQAIFGKSWSEIDRILRSGSAGLDEADKLAAHFGATVSAADATKLKEMKTATAELELAFKGFSLTLARDVLPALTQVTNATASLVNGLRNLRSIGHAGLSTLEEYEAIQREFSPAGRARHAEQMAAITERLLAENEASLRALAHAERDVIQEASDEYWLSVDEAAQKATDAFEEQTAALQLQADTFGMSARQADIYKAALQGVSEQELQKRRNLDAQMTEQERLKKLEQDAAAILHRGEREIQGPAALEQGSQGAISAVNRAIIQAQVQSADPQERMVRAIQQARDASDRAANETRRLREAIMAMEGDSLDEEE